MRDADYWVKHLDLMPHPEGGCFREVYRSWESVHRGALPERYGDSRSFCTSIYFLLRGNEVSRLHRIKSDELWHFYAGSPLTLHVFDQEGNHSTRRLGGDPELEQSLLIVVEAGQWFGAVVDDQDAYSLVGCTVSPGFDLRDFELGDRETLVKAYPEHRAVVERLTKKPEPQRG